MKHDVRVDVRGTPGGGTGPLVSVTFAGCGRKEKVTRMFTRPNLPHVVTASHLLELAPGGAIQEAPAQPGVSYFPSEAHCLF